MRQDVLDRIKKPGTPDADQLQDRLKKSEIDYIVNLISQPEILKDLLNPVELNQPLQISKKWEILQKVSNIRISSRWHFPILL